MHSCRGLSFTLDPPSDVRVIWVMTWEDLLLYLQGLLGSQVRVTLSQFSAQEDSYPLVGSVQGMLLKVAPPINQPLLEQLGEISSEDEMLCLTIDQAARIIIVKSHCQDIGLLPIDDGMYLRQGGVILSISRA